MALHMFDDTIDYTCVRNERMKMNHIRRKISIAETILKKAALRQEGRNAEGLANRQIYITERVA